MFSGSVGGQLVRLEVEKRETASTSSTLTPSLWRGLLLSGKRWQMLDLFLSWFYRTKVLSTYSLLCQCSVCNRFLVFSTWHSLKFTAASMANIRGLLFLLTFPANPLANCQSCCKPPIAILFCAEGCDGRCPDVTFWLQVRLFQYWLFVTSVRSSLCYES